MQLDVEADVLPAPVGLHQGSCMEQDIEEGLQSAGRAAAWRPLGPSCLAEVWDWAPALLAQMQAQADGKVMLDSVRDCLSAGLQVNTDYSGMGGPEMSLHVIMDALASKQAHMNVRFWRASDILPHARAVLCCEAGRPGPEHVFGDILQRASAKTSRRLAAAHACAQRELARLLESGSEWGQVCQDVGAKMMDNVYSILNRESFDLDRKAFCYKHRRMCRVHGPESCEAPPATRLAVAGSTCTSWSRMGNRGHWAAPSALAFAVWASETAFWEPDMVLHECTAEFDVQQLERFFSPRYLISSIVFSPVQLGVPTSRPRRYTIMVHRDRRAQRTSFTLDTFGRMFFRTCQTSGHIFWCAPNHLVSSFVEGLASRLHLPANQPNGVAWPCRSVLPEGDLQRLLAYEKGCRKKRKALRCIVNLKQNYSFMRSLSEMVPTLLTKTSVLWSMQAERLLIPMEHLAVMGVPVFREGRDVERMFGVEILAREGVLTNDQIIQLSGNGMSSIAIGSVLLFALGVVVRPFVVLSNFPALSADAFLTAVSHTEDAAGETAPEGACKRQRAGSHL